MNIYRAKNATTDIPFAVRVVLQGEAYGRTNSLIHEREDPLIEFYDARHAFDHAPDGTPLGQFVSRYFLSTLEGKDSFLSHGPLHEGAGLCLDGGVLDWVVDAEFMSGLKEFLVSEGLIVPETVEDEPSAF